jgi:hypothetical protein
MAVAALGFVVVLWFSGYLVWSSTSGPGWIYLTIPAVGLLLSVGAAMVAFLITKRTWPAWLTGTLVLLACDMAAGVIILEQPFLF